MFTEPNCSASGLYAVDWSANFVHWLAWRSWLHGAFGRGFFPQRQTVNFAWPPTSGEGAVTVADQIRQTRETLLREPGRHTGAFKAVPAVIVPWDRWSPALCRDVSESERARRDAWGYSFNEAPTYSWMPRMGFRFDPPESRNAALPRANGKPKFVPRYVPGQEDEHRPRASSAGLTDAVLKSPLARTSG